MSQLNRVRRLANVLYYVTAGVMGVVAMTLAGVWVVAPPAVAEFQAQFPGLTISPELSGGAYVAVIVVSLLPGLIWLWVLDRMRRLFACYRDGEVMTDQPARHIQRLGQGFLCLGAVQFVSAPLLSVLLTSANGAGERSLSVGLNTEMMGFFIAAGLMTLIGWVMRDVSAVKAENEAFV